MTKKQLREKLMKVVHEYLGSNPKTFMPIGEVYDEMVGGGIGLFLKSLEMSNLSEKAKDKTKLYLVKNFKEMIFQK